MRQLGDLWVWVDRADHRLMIGNTAAARAGSGTTAVGTTVPPPAEPPPEGLSCLGVYALPDGPAMALHARIDPSLNRSTEMLAELLAPMASDRAPDMVLHYTAGPEGRRLWRDGALIGHGPADVEDPENRFNLLIELQRLLLSDRPLAALLHGSGLHWQGRNLVFLGMSGSGKSTLAALLAAEGGRYLGDDSLALVFPDCAIRPMRLAPTSKQGAWPLLAPHYPQLLRAPVHLKMELPFRYLADAPFDRRASVGPPDLLVFPRFSATEAPKLVRLTPIEVMLELARSGMWISPEHGEALFDMVCRTPAIALRHTPDMQATRTALLEACAPGQGADAPTEV